MRALLIAIALCACGDDSSSNKMDAPATSDGPRLTDSSGGGDGAPTADAAIMPGAACGSTTCVLGTEECCLGQNNVCKAAGTCPTQAFECDGPEDCPSAVCCFPNSGGSRCQTNNCNAVACHDDGDCPSTESKCCPKSFSPNYGVCQAAC